MANPICETCLKPLVRDGHGWYCRTNGCPLSPVPYDDVIGQRLISIYPDEARRNWMQRAWNGFLTRRENNHDHS